MPWYEGNIPDKWAAALARKVGARFAVEVILDPDGAAISLGGDRDIVEISEVVQSKELESESGAGANGEEGAAVFIQDVTLEFNDLASYYDPDNTGSPFHAFEGIVSEAVTAGATTVKLFPNAGGAFAAGEELEISDADNSERVIVQGYTADSGGLGYDEVEIAAPGLGEGYPAGARIYTIPIVGKKLLIKILNLTESTDEEITLFVGKIEKAPRLTVGKAFITCSDNRKQQLDSALIGADAEESLKLMQIGAEGKLESSINWSNEFAEHLLRWEITDGELPDGLSLDPSTGAISGAATEAGDFEIGIRITNENGESRSGSVLLKVRDRFNTEMDSALGLDDFRFADYFYSSREYHSLTLGGEGYIRLGWIGNSVYSNYEDTWMSGSNRGWYKLEDRYTPPCCEIVSPGTLTGDFALLGRIKGDNLLTVGYAHVAGIYVRKVDEGDDGYYGVAVGFSSGNEAVIATNIDDGNTIGSAAVSGTDLIFRIQRVGTLFSFAYRTPDGDWNSLGTKNATWTPGFVGACAVRTELSTYKSDGSIDIDFLRVYIGSLSVITTALPESRALDNFDFTVEAAGGAGDYFFDISSGALPEGLTLEGGTGRISGVVASDGTSTFTLRVTDGAGATATQELSIVALSENEILPDILTSAFKGVAYNMPVHVYVGGLLNREFVTVGERCPVGVWGFKWTSSTAFEVVAPRLGKFTGDISEDFVIENVLTIPATAWTSGMVKDDEMSFITGLSWENENPVSILYDLQRRRIGLLPKQIEGSSFFEEIEVGTVQSHDLATDEILISVTLPTLIFDDDVLEIGAKTVAVVTGNDLSGSFPPLISIKIAHEESSLIGEPVIIAERSAPDSRRSYDAEYIYCEALGLRISLTLDREMSISEAVSAICAHGDLVQFHDSGMEGLHVMRPRYQSAVKTLGENEIKEDVSIDPVELANVITIFYAYDYTEQQYLKSYTFPERSAENVSARKYGSEIGRSVYCPGVYRDEIARYIAQRKYWLLSDGLSLVTVNLDFRGLLMRIGERWDLEITDPDIDARFETIKKGVKATGARNVILQGYDSRTLDRFAVAGVSEAGKCLLW